MAPWRIGVLKLAVVAMASMPQYNCDPFSDPATRLEKCLARAVKQETTRGALVIASCDLKITGRYVVVMHPPGEVSNEELVYAGLPENLVPELRAMRLRGSPAMYVIAADRTVTGIGASRSVLSSRTTEQSTFIEINHLMVIVRNAPPLTVEIGRPAGTPVVQRMR